MADGFGAERRFPRWIDAFRAVYSERGLKGFWRGFVPSALRAFPANAMALVSISKHPPSILPIAYLPYVQVTFEGVMRAIA